MIVVAKRHRSAACSLPSSSSVDSIILTRTPGSPVRRSFGLWLSRLSNDPSGRRSSTRNTALCSSRQTSSAPPERACCQDSKPRYTRSQMHSIPGTRRAGNGFASADSLATLAPTRHADDRSRTHLTQRHQPHAWVGAAQRSVSAWQRGASNGRAAQVPLK